MGVPSTPTTRHQEVVVAADDDELAANDSQGDAIVTRSRVAPSQRDFASTVSPQLDAARAVRGHDRSFFANQQARETDAIGQGRSRGPVFQRADSNGPRKVDRDESPIGEQAVAWDQPPAEASEGLKVLALFPVPDLDLRWTGHGHSDRGGRQHRHHSMRLSSGHERGFLSELWRRGQLSKGERPP